VNELGPASHDRGSLQYRVGDLLIDTGPQRVTRDGNVIALPKLSYDLLIALVRAAPNLLSIDALMGEVWPKLVVSPETVSQRIKLLRDALGDDPRNPRYVEGLRGRGYRLIPTVETVIAPTAAMKSPEPTSGTKDIPEPQIQSSAAPPLSPLAPRRRRNWAIIVAVALLVGALGIWKTVQRELIRPKTSVDVVAVRPRSVAVLPFESLSAEPDNEYIALGMADSVLHRLASLPELIVIARSSSFALGKPTPDARDAGRMLGARYLVEGSVQRAGKALRVNAQLIDSTTNKELWSLKIDRTIDDVFAVQDQIAQRVAQQLDVTLHGRPAEYANLGTDAYLAFLKGRSLIESRKPADVEESIRQLSRAVELAPSFAAAWAELARAKIVLVSVHPTPNKDAAKLWSEVKQLVDRAIEIDPAAGEPYFLRGMYKVDSDPGGAEADFRKGLELAPNFGPGLRAYAEYLFDRERYEETLAVIDRARLVDPLSAENHYRKGEVIRLGLGGSEEAAALYLQALAVKPDFYPAYTRLAQVRWEQGRIAEAIKYGEKSVAIEPNVEWTRDRLVWFYVDIGDLGAARDVLRGFAAGWPDIPLEEALICFRAGNLERAEALARQGENDPDFNDAFAIILASDAIVERAIAMHAPASAHRFILAIPALKKDRGSLAVVADNFPTVVQLATLEHFVGNHEVADDLANRSLEFMDRGGLVGVAGEDEWLRAVASALLGRNDAALDHLEKLIRSGHRIAWWVRLERDPSFAAIRTTPRFQAIEADTRSWLQSQLLLLGKMHMQGEVPTRAVAATPGGC
jgi:TolB-like protein/DNA-binding winged helix-turn-helix (wHTH) protein/tetratricopeptide (TPR) repeat protein